MKSIILYGSHYGTSKYYAEAFGEMTGIKSQSYKDTENLGEAETIIYFGSVYAGEVTGLYPTAKKLSEDARLILCTVGLADMTIPENEERMKNAVRQHIPQKLFDNMEMFHLKGGIDYKLLSLKHRLMMAGLVAVLKRKNENELTEGDRMILETYHKKAYFICLDDLKKIKNRL